MLEYWRGKSENQADELRHNNKTETQVKANPPRLFLTDGCMY